MCVFENLPKLIYTIWSKAAKLGWAVEEIVAGNVQSVLIVHRFSVSKFEYSLEFICKIYSAASMTCDAEWQKINLPDTHIQMRLNKDTLSLIVSPLLLKTTAFHSIYSAMFFTFFMLFIGGFAVLNTAPSIVLKLSGIYF